MRTPRSTATLAALGALLLLGACGGGGDDDAEDGGAAAATTSSTTTDDDTATTSTTIAAGGEARADIDSCSLLSVSELEAQASVAGVDAFKETSQEGKDPDARGAFRCTHYFDVIDGGSTITATLAVEVRSKNATSEYAKLHDLGERDRQDVTGLGDKAFYDVENGSITILDDDLVVIIDPGMPGVMEDTNRPVAEAVAPLVLARL